MKAALLLSGGTGTRIHASIPKQYLELGGKMIVTRSLEALLSSSEVEGAWIVAEESWRDKILSDAESAGLPTGKLKGFAKPGRSRQESILNGLEEILLGADRKESSVLIHDAARPFLSGKLIADCYAALEGHDGVMPALPMKDTVYLSSDGLRIEKLLERSALYAGQAPELFRLEPYHEANIRLLPKRILTINGASEPAVLAGMDIAIIPGEESNYKITTDADLARAGEVFLR